jgi:hypothetical protein
MATRGAKPMPLDRREHLGLRDKKKNTRPVLEVLPDVEKTIPEPHRQLIRNTAGGKGPGLELWERFWQAGAGWLQDGDIELLMIVCEQEDERAILRRLVFTDATDWRARTGLRQLEKLITDNLSLLGFTPTDRARIGFRSAGASDPLGEFRKRVHEQRNQA